MSAVTFPEELPISASVREIAIAIDKSPVVIVAGETGSGKTTQLPKICLAMGRGLRAMIGVTEPRRIAATSVAARVASELGVELGREVGTQIRFSNRTSANTYVKFMTDGILLAELERDRLLRAYDTLIIDEAHERTLNVDLLLGICKRLVRERDDLRVVISSATIETERFSRFFGGAPVIQVSGRTYPVETIYRPPRSDEFDLAETIANTVEEIGEIDRRGDVLVFLPGEREIRETESALVEHALPHTEILPLYGRLSQAEQGRVFSPSNQRRVVLATNVAETSLTIPGISYVVDTGLARVNRYQARSGVTQLLVERISRASADQRKGRAGRTASGVCFRLFEREDYDARAPFTDPEVLRVGLAGAILQMRAHGLGPLEDFPFLDVPPKKSVDEGYRVLEELGAIDDARELTRVGQDLARLPVDPRIGRMLLAAKEQGAIAETLVVASALGIQDPRDRPHANAARADQAHKRFQDESSDFLGLLRVFRFIEEHARKGGAAFKRAMRDAFISPVRAREWRDIHAQLTTKVREMGFEPNRAPASDEAVHRAILPGLLSRIGMWNAEHRIYIGARQTKFHLHPSSGLAKKPPQWVVAAELVETSKLFGRAVARIDPTWLEGAAGPLVKRSYGDPHWAERPAQVMAQEQLTLYGLPIVKERRVHFGLVDPVASRRIFIVHALVRGEWSPATGPGSEPRFVAKNRELFAEVSALRARARRSDMQADEQSLVEFFDARVPATAFSGKTFDQWRREAEPRDPSLLCLSREDVLVGDASDLTPERYPEVVRVGGATLPLVYAFDPGEDHDGITMTVPLALLLALDPDVLEWTIPGWMAEKIAALVETLPRAAKRAAQGDGCDLLAGLTPFETPLRAGLAKALREQTGVRIDADALRTSDIPPHLRTIFRVVDERGKTIAASRELADLRDRYEGLAREAWTAIDKSHVERERLSTFPEVLAERATLSIAGASFEAAVGLADEAGGVALRVFATPAAADRATRAAIRRLAMTALAIDPKSLAARVPTKVATGALVDEGHADPRAVIATRALDEALASDGQLPQTKKAFDERVERARAELGKRIASIAELASDIATELALTRAAMKKIASQPGSPKAALDDMRSQLARLVPPDLFVRTPRERLAHVPRYLHAMRVRLERIGHGPQKDQAKAEQIAPHWNDWLRLGPTLRARADEADLERFRWLLEEFRVSVFAPELKTAIAVSPQRVAEAWAALTED